MATKNFQFFIDLSQLMEFLASIVSKLGLWLILYRRGREAELVCFSLEDRNHVDRLSNYDCIFISMTEPDINSIDEGEFAPAKYGWLQLDIPKENGNVLYLSDLAVKTDWYDAVEKKTYENKELIKFYNKIKKILKDNLSSPIFAMNTKTGGTATYKDMAYAESAREWEENGGELRQLGVENVKFSTKQLN